METEIDLNKLDFEMIANKYKIVISDIDKEDSIKKIKEAFSSLSNYIKELGYSVEKVSLDKCDTFEIRGSLKINDSFKDAYSISIKVSDKFDWIGSITTLEKEIVFDIIMF